MLANRHTLDTVACDPVLHVGVEAAQATTQPSRWQLASCDRTVDRARRKPAQLGNLPRRSHR
jgi:hypothetical protein